MSKAAPPFPLAAALSVTLLCAVPAVAQTTGPGLRDVQQARNFAMGGAYRALGLGAESVNGNPAAVSMFPRYVFELSGAWDIQSKYAFGGVSVMDSTTPVGGGIAYHLVSLGRGETRRTAHLNTAAFSVPFSPSFIVGASGTHILMTGANEANAITMDAGVLIRPLEFLSVGFSGHNLIDVANPDVTRYYALSVGYLGGMLSLAFDLRADFGLAPTPQLAYAAGGEYIFGQAIPVRAGWALDTITSAQHLSFGFGLLTQGGGFDVGYRHELGGQNGRLISLTFKFQS